MTPGAPLLDEAVGTWHFRERHRVRVTGDPDRVRRAFEETTWG